MTTLDDPRETRRALRAGARVPLAGLLSLALLAVAGKSAAQECASPKSEWLFCDDFESSADQNGQLGLWDDQGLGPQNLVIATGANVHSGARALEITAHKGQDTGGGPTKWFLPGRDDVYVRFWTRFASDYHYLHHMVFIGASEASNKWAAMGTAGCRPSGSNFFVTQVEPFAENGNNPPPGVWGFYTYSNDMQCDPGGSCSNYANPQQICDDCATKGSPCQNGLECCWGANNMTSPPVSPPLGSWTCLEAHVQANSGGQSNGKQTLWVDGAQVGEWTGIRFRTDDALKINSLGLWHYVTDDVYASGQTEQTLWFDDVVVSSAPIGCGAGGSATGGAGGTAGAGTGGSSGSAAGGSSSGGTSAGGSSGSASGGSSNSGGSGATSTGGTSGGAAKGGSSNGGASASAQPAEDSGGCGCRTVPAKDARSWFVLPVWVVVLALRSRRRRAKLRSTIRYSRSDRTDASRGP